MNFKKKLSICVLVMVLVLGLGISSIQPARAQFVLSYDYPSANGNGIAYINAYVDSVYVVTMYNDPDSYPDATPTNPLEVNEGVNISLKVGAWLNASYVGVSSLAEGMTVLRHSIVVKLTNGTTVFSQQNFTYSSSTDAMSPMYFYDYWIVLDFVPVSGAYYTTTVVYELYY